MCARIGHIYRRRFLCPDSGTDIEKNRINKLSYDYRGGYRREHVLVYTCRLIERFIFRTVRFRFTYGSPIEIWFLFLI